MWETGQHLSPATPAGASKFPLTSLSYGATSCLSTRWSIRLKRQKTQIALCFWSKLRLIHSNRSRSTRLRTSDTLCHARGVSPKSSRNVSRVQQRREGFAQHAAEMWICSDLLFISFFFLPPIQTSPYKKNPCTAAVSITLSCDS